MATTKKRTVVKKKLGFSTKKAVFININLLPPECRKLLDPREDERYYLYDSEMTPTQKEGHWGKSLTMKNIEKYKKICDFKGTINEFITDNLLDIDKWLIDSGYDFDGVEAIFFDTWNEQ